MTKGIYEVSQEVIKQVNKVILGKENEVQKIMAAILARGHILIDDIPGVGKTSLAISFSKAMNLKYSRMQFTPDIMPSDITGFTVYRKEKDSFEFKEGAIMANLFLADEINRTSSKTQSALLEAMEEGKVTVDGVTREIEKPFNVIATQNPVGSIGTTLLPESQLDRFMIKISLGYPNEESEIKMLLQKHASTKLEEVVKVADKSILLEMQKEVESVYVHEDILQYVVKLVSKTRENKFFQLGVSPRGSIAIVRMAKAIAFLNERDFVVPEDIKYCFIEVVSHRVILSSIARSQNLSIENILFNILDSVAINEQRV